MFGKSRNGAAVKPTDATLRGNAAARKGNGVAEQVLEMQPERDQLRAWTLDHPWLALGSGLAAGFVATRVWTVAKENVAQVIVAPPGTRDSKRFDTRGLRRASAALWLIPMIELARFGIEAANGYRQHVVDSDSAGAGNV